MVTGCNDPEAWQGNRMLSVREDFKSPVVRRMKSALRWLGWYNVLCARPDF